MTFGLAAAGALVTSAAATACSAEGDARTPSSHSSSTTSGADVGPSSTTPAPPGAPGEPSSPGSLPAETGSQATSTEPSAPALLPPDPSPAVGDPAAGDPADGNPATVDSTPEPSDSSAGRPTAPENASTPDAELGPDGGSPVANQEPAPLPSPDAGGPRLSFSADIWPIYEMTREPPFVYPGGTTYGSCVVGGVCHGGERPGAGLRMPDAQTAYEMLLEAPSQSSLCEGTLRVVAEHPEESCLILFYEGRLHDELDWVDKAEIDLMRQWITQGAHP